MPRHRADEPNVLPPPGEHRNSRISRNRLILAGIALAVVVAGILALSVHSLGETTPRPDSIAQSADWLRANVKGPVLSDPGFDQRLVRQSMRVVTPAACASGCPGDWLISTAVLRTEAAGSGPLAAALANSTLTAVFGSGENRIEIRHPGTAPAAQLVSEVTARRTVGRALTEVPRVTEDPGVKALMIGGRVDPRVLAMIATLAERGPVHVLGLAAVPGEDPAGQPRRQLLLAAPPGGAGGLAAFFAAQANPYRPDSATPAPGGLRVVYPPLSPPHLLDAFAVN